MVGDSKKVIELIVVLAEDYGPHKFSFAKRPRGVMRGFQNDHVFMNDLSRNVLKHVI